MIKTLLFLWCYIFPLAYIFIKLVRQYMFAKCKKLNDLWMGLIGLFAYALLIINVKLIELNGSSISFIDENLFKFLLPFFFFALMYIVEDKNKKGTILLLLLFAIIPIIELVKLLIG